MTTSPPEDLAGFSDALADAVERAARSTVRVDGRNRIAASGVAWPTAGAIVTADHVLERDDDIRVGLPDGSEVAATVAARDPGSDLAVLRIEDGSLEPAELSDGEERVGQLVLAVGRPTEGGVQASLGAVSAVGGAWRTFRGGRVGGFIAPDLVFYPGFSGGPLVDARGRVAGVNSSRLRRGSGLSIPGAAVTDIVGMLLEHGRVRRGYLGVASQPARLPEALAAKLDGQPSGLLIVNVEEGSPAAAGGLLLGDILVRIGEARTEDHAALQAALGGDLVGTATTVTVLRGGERRELELTIGERAER